MMTECEKYGMRGFHGFRDFRAWLEQDERNTRFSSVTCALGLGFVAAWVTMWLLNILNSRL
jgi:hypothetical protein